EDTSATLTLTVAPDAPATSKQVRISLWSRARLDEQTMTVTVLPFLRPLLKQTTFDVTLTPGTARVVEVPVLRQENLDPLTVRMDPLPEGVHQQTLPSGQRAADVMMLELRVEAGAKECVQTGKLLLLVAGVPSSEGLIKVIIEKETVPIGVTLHPPA